MTQPRPTAEELVEAVGTFLADEVLPTLEGRLRFHVRVAVNVLETVGRELRDGPVADEVERSGLLQLLAGSTPVDRDGCPLEAEGVESLSRELASQIRAGTIEVSDPGLVDHLTRTARADVSIANPKWLPDDEPTG
jgi:hypothetical protein